MSCSCARAILRARSWPKSILRKDGGGRFNSFSAGSSPKGAVNPLALEVLESYGYPTDGLASKSWDAFAGPGAPAMDFVLTVCDNAAGEACPLWPGQPMTAHWGIEDPAAVEGSDLDKERAFVTAFRHLKNCISLLVNLPVELAEPAGAHAPSPGHRPHRGQHRAEPESRMKAQRIAAEALGTGLLLATVIGSGIMGERLAGGNVALALLGNTLATGAILVVLITALGPISGAHFNPAVSAVFALRRELPPGELAAYVLAQIVGGIAGVLIAHGMFERVPVPALDQSAIGTRAVAVGSGGCVRPRPHHPADAPRQSGSRRGLGRPLHNGRLLVHRLDLVRQSRRHHRQGAVGHLRRHPARRRGALHFRPAGGRGGRPAYLPLACARGRGKALISYETGSKAAALPASSEPSVAIRM